MIHNRNIDKSIPELLGYEGIHADINDPREFLELTEPEKELLVTWIKTHILPRKTINEHHTSYGLKHCFEDDKKHGGFYVTNGAFKGAMLQCGFESDPNDWPNWYYHISEKSPCLSEYYGEGTE